MLLATSAVGLAVAGLAIAFGAGAGKSSSEVLFSGQSDLGPFISNSANYTVGALLLLLVRNGIAYGASLSSFRGGPTSPAMFLGAAAGVALSRPGCVVVDQVFGQNPAQVSTDQSPACTAARASSFRISCFLTAAVAAGRSWGW